MQKCLIVKEDGLIYAAEVPEEPVRTDYEYYYDIAWATTLDLYRRAVQYAKESAVLCADQEKAIGLLYMNASRDNFQFRGDYVVGIKPGIYPIPDGHNLS